MDETQPKPRRSPPLAWYLLTTSVEWFVLAEILWYYLHNGEQTLHEAIGEWAHTARVRARERASVRRALNMIRDLPET